MKMTINFNLGRKKYQYAYEKLKIILKKSSLTNQVRKGANVIKDVDL